MLWLLLTACGPPPASAPDPGHLVARRLNRVEYDNTVRDLFGTALHPSVRFPADDFGQGFDNLAALLSVSALHVEGWDRAATDLLDELFGTGTVAVRAQAVEAESAEARADVGNIWDVSSWILWTEGAIEATFWVDAAGSYDVGVEAYGQQAGDALVHLTLTVDGAEVASFDVDADLERYVVRIPLAAGAHVIGAVYDNEYKAPPYEDRNLVVDRLLVEGPHGLPRTRSPAYATIVSCDPADIGEGPCAEAVVRRFGRRLLRRPLSEAEVASKLRHYGVARAAGGDFDEGLRAALHGLLLSPYFLYRVEPDPRDGARVLNGYELASRLSYFLWASTPDERLLDLAQSGALVDGDVLLAETQRMLDDPRARSLVDHLAGQWLGILAVGEAVPSEALYPTWNVGLRASLQDELRTFVDSVLRADRPLGDLLRADGPPVDARAAAFYGAEPTLRPGLLLRGGWLAATSLPTRTSPVMRGNWVLANLLCAEPPPPPSNVPPLETSTSEGLSLREQLERHRSDPACSPCHAAMDPIGLAFEGYDAIGQPRTVDDLGYPIDVAGVVPDVGSFDGPVALQAQLAADPRLSDCAVRKVLTYALGRGLTDADEPVVADLTRSFNEGGTRFEGLIKAVVMSRSFRWRHGAAP